MKQNYRRRHLTIRTGLDDISLLESFLDKICDDFHIYDEYYGNVVSTLTTAYELITENSPQQRDLEIHFQSLPTGVKFFIKPGEDFLQLAAKHMKIADLVNNPHDDGKQQKAYDESDNKLLLMTLLSDHVLFDSDKETIDITFYISGINDMLAMQRTQMLTNYYERLLRKTKASQQ